MLEQQSRKVLLSKILKAIRCVVRELIQSLGHIMTFGTFASLLLTAGAPIAYVPEQMGHSNIELTVKRYGHLQPGANRKFINDLPGARYTSEINPRSVSPGA